MRALRILLLIVCSNILLLALPSIALAQESVNPGLNDDLRPVKVALTAEIGRSAARNTYLAPLLYNGTSLSVRYERWRTMRSGMWINQQIIDADFASGDSENGKLSSMYSGRGMYRYAMHREIKNERIKELKNETRNLKPETPHGLSLLLGGFAGLDGGFDYNLKTAGGNNPAAARIVGNLGASAVANYGYRIKDKDCSVSLQVQMPLFGVAFMPEYGASYYETFLLDNTDNNVHFTSLHNQQDLDVRLTTDIPLSVIPCFKKLKTVIRVGGYYHIETMDINHIVERYSTVGLCVGWTWRYLPL